MKLPSFSYLIMAAEKTNKSGMVAHACNPNTREVEAEGPRVQDELQLHQILPQTSTIPK